MLTKYNRRTVSASSGAVIGGAFVRFYNQNTGAPVTAYNDAAGTSPIGTIVTSGTNGEVEVFLPPGLYRITVAVGSDIVEEITHEPITSNAAIIEAKTPAIGIMGLDSPAGDSLIVTGSSGLSEFVSLDDFKDDLAFTTADVTEDSGFLYHTVARVRATLLDGLSTATNAVISAADSILSAFGKLQAQISNLTTSAVTEGTNLYFTSARVLSTILTGLSTATNSAITAADSVLSAMGKLQKQITDLTTTVTGKEPVIGAGTVDQYWRGDKSWQTRDKNRILVNWSAGSGDGPLASNPDRIIFLADRGYNIISVRYIHTTAAATAGATGTITKETGASGGVGSGLVVATVALDGTALTVQAPSLTNTTLIAGDRLSFYINANIITNVRNVCVNIILEEV